MSARERGPIHVGFRLNWMPVDFKEDRLRGGTEPREDVQKTAAPGTATYVVDVIARSRKSREFACGEDAVPRLAEADPTSRGRRALGAEEVVAPNVDLTFQHKDDAVVLPVVVGWKTGALAEPELAYLPEPVS